MIDKILTVLVIREKNKRDKKEVEHREKTVQPTGTIEWRTNNEKEDNTKSKRFDKSHICFRTLLRNPSGETILPSYRMAQKIDPELKKAKRLLSQVSIDDQRNVSVF